ncbi:uncharacterized protein P884DRAFT_258944 [Thermothelomyces heterothallicus CBS 202.75]|uniref:uncharacterized protein n=1 Tax=Thermothelomyces heterothallicus CBS 202.75 TaxID=1149848 RepID=UPI003743939F
MPAPGDQHNSYANCFEPPPQRVSEWTAQEIATLQSRLDKQLGPEYISTRPGPSGQKLHYITAEKLIQLANEVFGFNGWSSAIRDIKIDYFDKDERAGKYEIGVTVIVRVTLRDGTYHEDLGFGHTENIKNKYQAFEKAKKAGTTDALKRTLRQFGSLLGNCIYDKAYLSKVTKLKPVPVRFDENALHRHPDYAAKKEPAAAGAIKEEMPAPPMRPPPLPQVEILEAFEDFLVDLDEADFNEGDPDDFDAPDWTDAELSNLHVFDNDNNEVGDAGNNVKYPPAKQLASAGSTGNRGPPDGRPPQQFNHARPAPQRNNAANQNQNQNQIQNQNQNQKPQIHMTPPQSSNSNNNNNNNNNHNNAGPPPGDEPVGFFSARAVKGLPEETLATGKLTPKPGQAFNPRLESPSIPRTPGIDHSTTKPLSKSGQHVPGRKSEETEAFLNNSLAANTAAPGGGGTGNAAGPGRPGLGAGPAAGPKIANVVNPQLDQTRRIGAPISSSPLGNRGQFRPLTVKRPAAGADTANGAGAGVANGNGTSTTTAGRVPLADVPSNRALGAGGNGGGGGPGIGPEAKRQRVS